VGKYISNFRVKFALLIIVGLVAGCAGVTKDIKVETESDPQVDLAAYKTYAWLASAEVVNDPYGAWEPPELDADTELRLLISRELRARGMKEVATSPDLVIAFAAGVNTEVFQIVENPENKMYTLKSAPKGALVVVMIDPATSFPVWVGSAYGDVKSGRTASEVRQRLSYAVRTMFARMSR